MENLKEIWPCQSGAEEIDVSMLRTIQVRECGNLVNLFPKNPMILLHRLEELKVSRCPSVQVLFNMEVVNLFYISTILTIILTIIKFQKRL